MGAKMQQIWPDSRLSENYRQVFLFVIFRLKLALRCTLYSTPISGDLGNAYVPGPLRLAGRSLSGNLVSNGSSTSINAPKCFS